MGTATVSPGTSSYNPLRLDLWKPKAGWINSPSDRAPPPVLEVDRCLELLSVVAWAFMRFGVSGRSEILGSSRTPSHSRLVVQIDCKLA